MCSLQDTSGTKEDILAALTLEPDNEECISLIARAFPGKSKTDLMQSHDATVCKRKLESEFERLTVNTQQHQETPSEYTTNRMSTQTLQHLMGLELKFADIPDVLETDNADIANKEDLRAHNTVAVFVQTPTTRDLQSSGHDKDESWKGNTRSEDNESCAGILQIDSSAHDQREHSESGACAAKSEEMSIRQWSVLCHPLPELTSDPHGVLPALKECLQEHTFHKKIYYSKKNVSKPNDQYSRLVSFYFRRVLFPST